MDAGITSQSFLIGAGTGFIVGALLGFAIGRQHRNNNSTKALTQLQLVSVAMFFGYLGISAALEQPVSEFIAVGILSLTGGEALGLVLQKTFDKGGKK